MNALPLNCDLGEGCGRDAELMPMIDQASIACGGHAGDGQSMRACVQLARDFAVEIGAHPAYPDTEGFGRRSLDITPAALGDSLAWQLESLATVAEACGVPLAYIKPHGALYHDLWCKPAVREVVLPLAEQWRLPLVVQAGRGTLPDADEAIALVGEVFADRAYAADGQLLGRSEPDAVLNAPAAARQVNSLITGGELVAVSGARLPMRAQTICLHGDNPQAVDVARAIRRVMPKS